MTVACDVTDESSCQSAITGVAAAMGGIDALVYCPGIGPLRRLVDIDAATWNRVLSTNVTGAEIGRASCRERVS